MADEEEHAPAQPDPRVKMGERYRALFDSPAGREVLADLFARCGLMRTSMTMGEPHMTAFNEGRRSVGLDIIQLMSWSEMELLELGRQQVNQVLKERASSAVN